MNDKMKLILLITLIAIFVIGVVWYFIDMKAHPLATMGGAAIVLIVYNAKWIWNTFQKIRYKL